MTLPEAAPDRPLVVIVFDAITAQRAVAVLEALAPERAPVPVLDGGAWSAFAAALPRGPAGALVALISPSALQGFLQRVGIAASLACVEPGLFLLADLLGEVQALDPQAIRRLKAASAQLHHEGLAARLSMEALFLRPAEIGLQLRGLLEEPRPAPTGPVADPDAYKAALAALMASARRDRGPFFSLGTRYAVSQTGLGRIVLGRGWSHAEAGFTWSDSVAATLALMVPPAPAGPLRVRFGGHVIDERIAITTFVGGIRMVTTTTGPLRAVEIDVPLTFERGTGDAAVEVRFVFNTVCVPTQLGWSTDGRSLAFALARFEFYTDGRWTEPPLDPADVVRLAGEMPVLRRGIHRTPAEQADREPPPLGLLRHLLDRRPGRVCVVLIQENAVDEQRWGETVQALTAEVLVLAAPASARLLFASAPDDVLQVEGGLDPVLAVLAHRGLRPDLLFWSSGATPVAFDALWDRLLADGGRPAVLIRAEFDAFTWILRSRQWHDFMITAVGDFILFDPLERMAEL